MSVNRVHNKPCRVKKKARNCYRSVNLVFVMCDGVRQTKKKQFRYCDPLKMEHSNLHKTIELIYVLQM